MKMYLTDSVVVVIVKTAAKMGGTIALTLAVIILALYQQNSVEATLLPVS